MKKLLVIGFVFLAACQNKDGSKPTADSSATVALHKGTNSDSLSLGLSDLMNNYYLLKDAFIREDLAQIDRTASSLSTTSDKLPLGKMKADVAIIETAKVSAQSIVAEIQGLLGEKNIEDKRKSFQTISEQLYDLLRTVGYDQEIVYHFSCADALGGSGATWLNNRHKVQNPYLPKQDKPCGDIIDSLDFSKK